MRRPAVISMMAGRCGPSRGTAVTFEVPGDQPIAWPKAEEAARALAQLPERKVGICVSTVCGPTGHRQGWARAKSTAVVANGICRTSELLFWVGSGSTIADAADGGDGVFGK